MKYLALALLITMSCPPIYNWSDALVDMAPPGPRRGCGKGVC